MQPFGFVGQYQSSTRHIESKKNYYFCFLYGIILLIVAKSASQRAIKYNFCDQKIILQLNYHLEALTNNARFLSSISDLVTAGYYWRNILTVNWVAFTFTYRLSNISLLKCFCIVTCFLLLSPVVRLRALIMEVIPSSANIVGTLATLRN